MWPHHADATGRGAGPSGRYADRAWRQHLSRWHRRCAARHRGRGGVSHHAAYRRRAGRDRARGGVRGRPRAADRVGAASGPGPPRAASGTGHAHAATLRAQGAPRSRSRWPVTSVAASATPRLSRLSSWPPNVCAPSRASRPARKREYVTMSSMMLPDEVQRFLAYGTRTAKLATIRADGRPHVVPVWFVLDGDDIVFTTGTTTVKAV